MAAPLVVGACRTLEPSDLALRVAGPVSKPPVLNKLHARHHAVARALAQGMRPGVVAATYGYDPSRISIFQSDPTFRDLVEHYKREEGFDGARVNERLEVLTHHALDELLERFEEAPEAFTARELERLVALGADRTGHGPKSTTETNINIGFGERLRAASARLRELEAPTIDAEVIPPEAAE